MKPQFRIVGITFLALFLQMVLIRYMAVEMLAFLFFKNFVLMASFLGLGIGFGLSRSEVDLMGWFAPVCGVVLVIALFAQDLGLNHFFLPTGDNAFQFHLPDTAESQGTLVLFYVLLAVAICAVGFIFVPLGQRLGQIFATLPPQTSYTYDLLGSILGVLVYALTSFLGLSPKFAAVGAVAASALLVLGHRKRVVTTLAISVCLALVFVSFKTIAAPSGIDDQPQPRSPYHWSPYNQVHVEAYPLTGANHDEMIGYKGFLNGFYYFDLLNLKMVSDDKAILSRWGHALPLGFVTIHYSVPYLLRPDSQSVLILGGGPGNDAAAALVNHATDITVVEIDPVIAWLGHAVHPLHPYDDPHVTVDVNDARAHMAAEKRQFDVVSFGHLDSITLVSSFSSIRLDSYVYTLQSMKQAYALVKPNGLLVVSFAATPWVAEKMVKLLATATSVDPMILQDPYLGSYSFIVPKGGNRAADEAALFNVARTMHARIGRFDRTLLDAPGDPIPTDDWPFLFLKEKALSPYHLIALVLIMVLTVAFIRPVFRVNSVSSVDWHLFWLGAGFLLIETRSLVQLGLLFGSTWVVYSIAIVGVLLMNLVALAVLARVPNIPLTILYPGLFLTIALNLVLPIDLLLGLPTLARLVVATALIFSPVLFAGFIFTLSFRGASDPPSAFGSNMLGAVLGGCLEYLSVVHGLRLLWFLALGVYLLSLLALRRRPAATASLQPVA